MPVVPLSALDVRGTRLLVTLDMPDYPPLTEQVSTGRLETELRALEATLRMGLAARGSIPIHVAVRDWLRAAVGSEVTRQPGPARSTAATAGLWLALNHPQQADTIRRGIVGLLQRHRLARLTVSCNEANVYGFALSEHEAPDRAEMRELLDDAQGHVGHAVVLD